MPINKVRKSYWKNKNYSRKFGFIQTSSVPNISPDIHSLFLDTLAQDLIPPSDPI